MIILDLSLAIFVLHSAREQILALLRSSFSSRYVCYYFGLTSIQLIIRRIFMISRRHLAETVNAAEVVNRAQISNHIVIAFQATEGVNGAAITHFLKLVFHVGTEAAHDREQDKNSKGGDANEDGVDYHAVFV